MSKDEGPKGLEVTGRLVVKTYASSYYSLGYGSLWSAMFEKFSTFLVPEEDQKDTAYVDIVLPGCKTTVQAEVPVWQLKQALLSNPDYPRHYYLAGEDHRSGVKPAEVKETPVGFAPPKLGWDELARCERKLHNSHEEATEALHKVYEAAAKLEAKRFKERAAAIRKAHLENVPVEAMRAALEGE